MSSLARSRIEQLLDEAAAAALDGLELFDEIDSTNSHLLRCQPPGAGRVKAAIAAHQSAGRGRHERRWLSSPGKSLCLSTSYTFRRPPENLPPLTLALGLGMGRRLAGLCGTRIDVKWPNDLLLADRKLGGILTETHTNRAGTTIVAGVGINVGMPPAAEEFGTTAQALSPTGLVAVMSEPPSRERIAASLLNATFETLIAFDERGFADFRDAFAEFDWLSGKEIGVDTPAGDIVGIAAGIDDVGRLRVDTERGIEPIFSGSVRIVSEDSARK